MTTEVSEIKEIVLEEKENILKVAQESIVQLESASSTLETIVTEKKLVINSKQEQVNVLLSQIDKEQKVIDQVQVELNENKIQSSQLTEHIRSLQIATTESTITTESAKLQDNVKSLQKLISEHEEKYENKDAYGFLLKDPQWLSAALEKGDRDIYTMDDARGPDASIVGSSKLQYENGVVEINTLEKDVKPTPNATLIPIASLLDILCDQPIVYLDLEAQGQPLGRLRILLTCGPRRKEQAILMFTGIGGTTLKGSCFDNAGHVGEPGEFIECSRYLDDDGCPSNKLLIQNPERETRARYTAGNVTGSNDDTGFRICTTTDPENHDNGPELGEVLTGLDMLSRAITQFQGDRQIDIVNAGLEFTSEPTFVVVV